jgi:hypothetical protein
MKRTTTLDMDTARRVLTWLSLLVSVPTSAHVWCVSTADDLRSKLLIAASNSEDDTIELVRGTYLDAGNEFSFNSTQGFGLVIDGGFDAGCTHTAMNPRFTILDGGGLTQVLSTNSPGRVTLRYLTIRNGMRSGSSGGGLQMNGSGPASEAILDFDILSNNASDYAVGAAYIGVDGPIHIDGNLVVGNSAPNNGGLYVYVGTTSIVYMTNNTVTGNTVTSPGTGPIVFINYSNPAIPSAYVSNNVFWGNTSSTDLQFYDSRAQLASNDYASIQGAPAGGSAGNVSVNPLFAGTGDFHLSSTSPLLGAGTLTPVGGLPGTDIEGHPRTFNNLVDMGAYERGDEIFVDGFDP